MQFPVVQTLDGLAPGGPLFRLSSGFSLIFGSMRMAGRMGWLRDAASPVRK